MFDVSLGQFLVTAGVGLCVLGKKDFPKLGRFVGLYTGKTTGVMLRMKNDVLRTSESAELSKLQHEFRQGMTELNAIRSELTSVSSITTTTMDNPRRVHSVPMNHEVEPNIVMNNVVPSINSRVSSHRSAESNVEAPQALEKLIWAEAVMQHQNQNKQSMLRNTGADLLCKSIMDRALLEDQRKR